MAEEHRIYFCKDGAILDAQFKDGEDVKDTLNRCFKKISDLEEKLAEKEEQVRKSQEMYFETLKEYDELEDNFNNTSLELWAEKIITKDKISFALEQINKLKNDLYDNEKINIRACDFDEIDNIFDNQIKQLKEGK